MAEHLNTNKAPFRPYNVLFYDLSVYFSHLIHIEFARQHYHIGKTGIEFKRVDIRYIKLSAKVYFNSYAITISHYRHIRSDNRRNFCFFCGLYNTVHRINILAIDHGIHSKICLYAVFSTRKSYFAQVVYRKMIG